MDSIKTEKEENEKKKIVGENPLLPLPIKKRGIESRIISVVIGLKGSPHRHTVVLKYSSLALQNLFLLLNKNP
jgi:hypothetical protein